MIIVSDTVIAEATVRRKRRSNYLACITPSRFIDDRLFKYLFPSLMNSITKLLLFGFVSNCNFFVKNAGITILAKED